MNHDYDDAIASVDPMDHRTFNEFDEIEAEHTQQFVGILALLLAIMFVFAVGFITGYAL